MSYSLRMRRSSVERLKEEAWRFIGGPRRVLTDQELAQVLLVSPSTLARIKAGERVPGMVVAAVLKIFGQDQELVQSVWYVEEPELQAAA